MNRFLFRLSMCLFLAASSSWARTKSKAALPAVPPRDSFEIVGHLALAEGPVSRLVPATHYSSSYMYAELATGGVAVIDVTDSARPSVISRIQATGTLLTATGDVALATSETQPSSAPAPRTISILDFSDKTNPKVTRQFPGVTSIGFDDPRGLVFLVNAEGLWILHRNQAVDPEVMARYAHDVVYNH